MSAEINVGINGRAQKVKNIYVGVDGKARKILRAYVGVNNVARLAYSSEHTVYFKTNGANAETRGSCKVCLVDGSIIKVEYGKSYDNTYTVPNGYEIFFRFVGYCEDCGAYPEVQKCAVVLNGTTVQEDLQTMEYSYIVHSDVSIVYENNGHGCTLWITETNL